MSLIILPVPGVRWSAPQAEAQEDKKEKKSVSERQKKINEVNTLQTAIDGLAVKTLKKVEEGLMSRVLLASFYRYLKEDLKTLKGKVEALLNSAPLQLEALGDEAYLYEFRDALSEAYPKYFGKLKRRKRIFGKKRSDSSKLLTLFEMEKAFIKYYKAIQEFRKITYVGFFQEAAAGRAPEVSRLRNDIRDYHLLLNGQGAKNFKKFVNAAMYTLVQADSGQYEVIGRLKENVENEIAALAYVKNKRQWKNILKRLGIHYLIQSWTLWDSFWISDRYKDAKNPTVDEIARRSSVLPNSCSNQYPAVVPYSVEILKREAKMIPEQTLFESNFYIRALESSKISISIMFNLKNTKRLIMRVPQWKIEYTMLKRKGKGKQFVGDISAMLQSMENKLSRLAMNWLFKAESANPYIWRGSEKYVRSQIRRSMARSKMMLYLLLVELLLHESKIKVNARIKSTLLKEAKIASKAFEKHPELKDSVTKIHELYKKSKGMVVGVHKMFKSTHSPRKTVERMIPAVIKLSNQVIAQDTKLKRLEEKDTLLAVKDTPANFRTVTLMLLPYTKLSEQLKDKKSVEILKKILVKDPSFKAKLSGAKDGTYYAAQLKYKAWLASSSGSVPGNVRAEVVKIAEMLFLHQSMTLHDLVSKKEDTRKWYENFLKTRLLSSMPILSLEVKYEDEKVLLYKALAAAHQAGASKEVKLDLVQKGVWQMKEKIKHETNLLCKADPYSKNGLKLLLAHSVLRSLGLKKFSNFEDLNEEVMKEITDDETTLRKAVGYGFLTIILLSFISGPLTRLPKFISRWIPKIPVPLMHRLHQLGLMVAPLAFVWMLEDAQKYFIEDPRIVDSLERWDSFRFSPSGEVPTFDQAIAALESEQKGGERAHKHIIHNRTILRVHQGVFGAFFPIHYAFYRGFLQSLGGFYRYRLPMWKWGGSIGRHGAIPAALGRLKIPTRFLTVRPGKELTQLTERELEIMCVRSIDKTIKASKLRKYIEKWLKILRNDLAMHEARWGSGARWEGTKLAITENVGRLWIPRHHEVATYFMRDRGKLAELIVEERMKMIVQAKLYEAALGELNTIKQLGWLKNTALSQIGLSRVFRKPVSDLQKYFGGAIGQNLRTLLKPEVAVSWTLANISTQRFLTLWAGAWVGYRGPLGKALQNLMAYTFLSKMKLGAYGKNGAVALQSQMAQEILVRKALGRALEKRQAKGLSTEEGDIKPKEIEQAMMEILAEGQLGGETE